MHDAGENKDAIRHGIAETNGQWLPVGSAGALVPTPITQPCPAPITKTAAASALALSAAACGGGGSGGGSTGGAGPVVATVRKPQTDAEAARFLIQASLSVSTGAITELRSEGYEPWLDRQISLANSQTGRGFLADRGFDRVDSNRFYNGTITGDYMVWSQLLSGGNL